MRSVALPGFRVTAGRVGAGTMPCHPKYLGGKPTRTRAREHRGRQKNHGQQKQGPRVALKSGVVWHIEARACPTLSERV